MSKGLGRIGSLAGFAAGVFVIFVICTLGCWAFAFATNDVFCIVGPDQC